MGRKVIDLTGKRNGFLTIQKYLRTEKRGAVWSVLCDCGNQFETLSTVFQKGKRIHCGPGCKARFPDRDPLSLNSHHGESRTRLHIIWTGMKQRCSDGAHPSRKYYYDRGIQVCEEWFESYIVFREWALANGYADDLTLDRKDVNGDYTPDNCRWATPVQQARNKTNSILLEFNGVTKHIHDWAEELGLSRHTLIQRYKKGKSVEDIFTKTRINRKHPVEIDGVTKSLRDWSNDLNIPYPRLFRLYNNGIRGTDLIDPNFSLHFYKKSLHKTVTIDRKTKTVAEWSDHFGVHPKDILHVSSILDENGLVP